MGWPATRLQNAWLNTAAVVLKSQPEFATRVNDLNVNLPCVGMEERIQEGLSTDLAKLIVNDRVQVLRGSFDHELKRCRMIVGELLGDKRECACQVAFWIVVDTQIPDSIPGFVHDLICTIENLVD